MGSGQRGPKASFVQKHTLLDNGWPLSEQDSYQSYTLVRRSAKDSSKPPTVRQLIEDRFLLGCRGSLCLHNQAEDIKAVFAASEMVLQLTPRSGPPGSPQ